MISDSKCADSAGIDEHAGLYGCNTENDNTETITDTVHYWVSQNRPCQGRFRIVLYFHRKQQY